MTERTERVDLSRHADRQRVALDDVLAGIINPGRVLDYETDLDGTPDAYTAMDDRRAIKSLIRVGSL